MRVKQYNLFKNSSNYCIEDLKLPLVGSFTIHEGGTMMGA